MFVFLQLGSLFQLSLKIENLNFTNWFDKYFKWGTNFYSQYLNFFVPSKYSFSTLISNTFFWTSTNIIQTPNDHPFFSLFLAFECLANAYIITLKNLLLFPFPCLLVILDKLGKQQRSLTTYWTDQELKGSYGIIFSLSSTK